VCHADQRCSYDEQYPVGYAVKETDVPNFSGSFYSRTKGVYPNPKPKP
jgi:hypothetical protein